MKEKRLSMQPFDRVMGTNTKYMKPLKQNENPNQDKVTPSLFALLHLPRAAGIPQTNLLSHLVTNPEPPINSSYTLSTESSRFASPLYQWSQRLAGQLH